MSNGEQTEKRVARIRSILKIRDTEDLLAIWTANNRDEWTDEAFIAIQAILRERVEEIPPQTQRYQPVDLVDEPDRVIQAKRDLQHAADYLDQGKYKEALHACDTAIRIAPHLASAYNLLGLCYDGLEQLEDAIAAYREAVRLDSEFADAQEHLHEAEAELSRAAQIDPAQEHMDLAVANIDAGELEEALHECELAIQIAPFLADAQNYRGMILQELERLDDAIDAYQIAVQLDPEFDAARENLYCARLQWEYELFHKLSKEYPEEGTISRNGEEIPEMSLDDLPELDETFAQYSGGLPPLFLDEKTMVLCGWPGNRTRPGRSGYDPLDSEYELAHMEGVILRQLIMGKFRTRNPLALFLMFFWGIMGCLSLLFTLVMALSGQPRALLSNIFFTPYIAVGAALLWNATLSLLGYGVDEDQNDLEDGPASNGP
jgi:tetratricopeptide (TPR) repeat protein